MLPQLLAPYTFEENDMMSVAPRVPDVKANCFDVQVRFPWVGLGVGECPPERQRSIWEGHPATRAVSMSSTNLEQISAAERTDGLPWVDLGVGGWPA